MKKVIVAIIVGIIIGTVVGIDIGVHSPKWVEEHPGYMVICTEIFGHVFEDVADKEGEHIDNAHASSIYWR